RFCVLFVFFFSSRRRHTRWPRDWSSDVCSSDLGAAPASVQRVAAARSSWTSWPATTVATGQPRSAQPWNGEFRDLDRNCATSTRSEERRVGKECRSRGGGDEERRKEKKARYVEE